MLESERSRPLPISSSDMELKHLYPHATSQLPERENKQLWIGDTVELVSPETLNGEQWVYRNFTVVDMGISRSTHCYLVETNLTEGDKAQVGRTIVLWLPRIHLRLVYRGPGSSETSGRWFYRNDDSSDYQPHIFPMPLENATLNPWQLRMMAFDATLDRPGGLSENDQIGEQDGGTRREPSSFIDLESRRPMWVARSNAMDSIDRNYADITVYETARVFENRFVDTGGYPRVHERHRHVYRRDDPIPDLNRRPFTDDPRFTTGTSSLHRPLLSNRIVSRPIPSTVVSTTPSSSTSLLATRLVGMGFAENQIVDSNLTT